MATGNGRSDSRVGEGGRLKGGDERQGGEVQPADDRRDAKTASRCFHMSLATEWGLFTGAAPQKHCREVQGFSCFQLLA